MGNAPEICLFLRGGDALKWVSWISKDFEVLRAVDPISIVENPK
jgi:hypothetical protein